MPWKLQKVKGGYQVVTEGTGRKHSGRPMSKKKATAQMRALYAQKRAGRIK
jgi:hypothetical protein